MADAIQENLFGSGKQQVTAVGLGGEGILRTTGRTAHARRVIQEALSQGITYFDSAPAYQESELYLGSVWQENPAARQKVFQASKSARRDKKGALADLEKTLKRLHTDYLDLWQIQEEDPEQSRWVNEQGQVSLPGRLAAAPPLRQGPGRGRPRRRQRSASPRAHRSGTADS